MKGHESDVRPGDEVPPSQAERLAELEQRVEAMTQVISHLAGSLQAVSAAFVGCLEVIGRDPRVSSRVRHHLEQVERVNDRETPDSFHAHTFDRVADVFRQAVSREAARGSTGVH